MAHQLVNGAVEVSKIMDSLLNGTNYVESITRFQPAPGCNADRKKGLK